MRQINLFPNKEEFDELLQWLDPDRGRAGKRYEDIRQNLIKLFRARGCTDVEDLADDTINRVAKKMPELRSSYIGNPDNYFFGVARNVFLEHLRKRKRVIEPLLLESSREELDPRLKCLEECLPKLPRRSSRMILLYYREKRRKKIDLHTEMSEQMGLKQTALRARVFRMRGKLRKCILECLQRQGLE